MNDNNVIKKIPYSFWFSFIVGVVCFVFFDYVQNQFDQAKDIIINLFSIFTGFSFTILTIKLFTTQNTWTESQNNARKAQDKYTEQLFMFIFYFLCIIIAYISKLLPCSLNVWSYWLDRVFFAMSSTVLLFTLLSVISLYEYQINEQRIQVKEQRDNTPLAK